MLYQTDNIEGAIRAMAERNKHCVAFNYNWCRSRIRARYNLIADVPSVLMRAWDANREDVVSKWRRKGGLMIYRHMAMSDCLPEADAIMFTEMPLTYKIFKKFEGRAKKDIIIFRPPDWSMHETTVNAKYEVSETYNRVLSMIQAMAGKNEGLTRNQAMALAHCGWDASKCAVFGSMQMEIDCGLLRGQFKGIFKTKYVLRGNHVRFDPYKPMAPPDEPDLLEIYQALEKEENVSGGMRLLKYGVLSTGYMRYFEKGMKELVKQRCVAKYEPVHIARIGWEEMDDEITDAIAGVRRRSYEKLRDMVDAAPVYPIERMVNE